MTDALAKEYFVMDRWHQLAKCEAATAIALVAFSIVYSAASWINQTLELGMPAGKQIALLFFALPLAFGFLPALLIFAPLYFLLATHRRMTFVTAAFLAATVALIYEYATRRYSGIPLAYEAGIGSVATAVLTHAQIRWGPHWYRL